MVAQVCKLYGDCYSEDVQHFGKPMSVCEASGRNLNKLLFSFAEYVKLKNTQVVQGF